MEQGCKNRSLFGEESDPLSGALASLVSLNSTFNPST